LQQGLEPSIMQSYWIKKNLFKRLGLFSTAYSLRGMFYYLCKLERSKELTCSAELRVFTDVFTQSITYTMLWNHFTETFRCIRKFFGLWHAIIWLFKQKDTKRLVVRTWVEICHALKPK